MPASKPPSPQKMLQSLPKHRDRGVSIEQLIEALNLSRSEIPRLRVLLTEFVRVGLAASKGGRYWLKHASGVLIGTLRGTRSGHAFVVPDDPIERKKGDLFINARGMGSALNGDTVIARVTGIDKRGREGRVEAVLHHANKTIIGKFVKLKAESVVSPIDEKFLYEIGIARSDTLNASDGDIVNVEITKPPNAGRPPAGRVIEVLGRPSDPGIDIEIIIRKHHLPRRFSESAVAEAEHIHGEITEQDLSNRDDLRGVTTITIDGETARDFDDAVSLEEFPNGRLRLGVHIADVSYYVREGTALDEAAFERGTSVYFPERAIPMLPERLSNHICSLKPKVDRLTMSVLLELHSNGRVADYRLTPSVIHSRERMTYTAVNEIITDPEGETARAYSHVKDMLLKMHQLTMALIKRREDRGAIDFDLPEAELWFNDEGQIGGIARSERNIAHRLIEEFMLLANETVAKHLESLNVPSLYRIHEEPNIEKVQEFAEIAASFGHKFSMHGPIPQRGLQRLAREIQGRPETRLLSYLMLRSLQRARYTPQNAGHYGLAMKTYTHFTSPIRRYPDLIVHRVLRELIERGREQVEFAELDLCSKHAIKRVSSGSGPLLDEEREIELRSALEIIGDQSSDRERAAAEAERELMDWRKAEFMADRVGDEFDGIITSVKDYGFYVELNEFFIEGLVHISALTGVFEYQERKHRLVEERTRRSYRLGDEVGVMVNRVDRVRHLIDFSIA
jgi:ribonuclease R